jgi:hypothetical protein
MTNGGICVFTVVRNVKGSIRPLRANAGVDKTKKGRLMNRLFVMMITMLWMTSGANADVCRPIYGGEMVSVCPTGEWCFDHSYDCEGWRLEALGSDNPEWYQPDDMRLECHPSEWGFYLALNEKAGLWACFDNLLPPWAAGTCSAGPGDTLHCRPEVGTGGRGEWPDHLPADYPWSVQLDFGLGCNVDTRLTNPDTVYGCFLGYTVQIPPPDFSGFHCRWVEMLYGCMSCPPECPFQPVPHRCTWFHGGFEWSDDCWPYTINCGAACEGEAVGACPDSPTSVPGKAQRLSPMPEWMHRGFEQVDDCCR